jgi:16S rRNA C967 or C1407 C5-methylase (RsmB/RsmF family)/NOL1/NOP2/fmu family ribosome biogenesis protein
MGIFAEKNFLLPPSLLIALEQAPGFRKESFVQVHEAGPAVHSLRINPAKITQLPAAFTGISAGAVPWSSYGYYLSERPSYTLDPLLHAGAYYVQEASSMFLEQALRQSVDLTQSLRVLDLCAAPGGKSTLLQSLISAESCLVSNEVIKSRAAILSENITKWGAANVIVTNNDPRDFQRLPGFFDVMVVDAPCSGSGLFRRDPGAISEWSESNVLLCSQRQQRILADAEPALKEGGILIYSTCSYSAEEDEDILTWLLEQDGWEPVQIPVDPDWQIIETTGKQGQGWGYRFYPDQVQGEGFFITVLRKTSATEQTRDNKKLKSEKLTSKEKEVISPWLQQPGDFIYIRQNEEVIVFPSAVEDVFTTVQNTLYIRKAGVKTGTIIREELVPDHELALAAAINRNVRSVTFDREEALQYLRREELKAGAGTGKGWSLVQYEGLNLGWIKVLPNRINNYYPAAWRILNK